MTLTDFKLNLLPNLESSTRVLLNSLLFEGDLHAF